LKTLLGKEFVEIYSLSNALFEGNAMV